VVDYHQVLCPNLAGDFIKNDTFLAIDSITVNIYK